MRGPEEKPLIEPPKPPDEANRLHTLRALGVLDTPPEETFDRVTRLACRVFDVPIALVSLVDEDRQWFKSRQGLEATETPREVSFCGHAVLSSDVLLVEDAHADERFHDNPLVTANPRVRFYAGCPLAAPNGSRVGTLCLIDHEPRELEEHQLEILKEMAAMVEHELAMLYLATFDSLTRLANRRGFEMISRPALAACRRSGRPTTLVFLDLDGFKQINDEHGHAEGDRALVEMAGCMRRAFRDSDVLARLGGDEFCALLTDAGEADLKSPLARLEQEVAEVNDAPTTPWRLRYSIGTVATYPSEGRRIHDLLREADERMYAAKRAGCADRDPAAKA
jgi:diguanylate cyclase (GGDEF)-like protein